MIGGGSHDVGRILREILRLGKQYANKPNIEAQKLGSGVVFSTDRIIEL